MSRLISLLILISDTHGNRETTVIFCLFLITPIKPPTILLWVAIAVGLCLFLLGFRLLARQRFLLTLSSAEINSAARGLVEVSGVATGPCTTVAPITGEPCFLYHTTAWQQQDAAKNEWKKVAEETLNLPFFIQDSTGQLLIQSRGADLELHPRFRGEYAPSLFDSNEVPLSVSGFLSRNGIAPDRNFCIEERLIKAEDTLFVAGTLTENPAAQARSSAVRNDAGTDDRNPVRNHNRNPVRNHLQRNPAQDNSLGPLPAPEVIRLVSTTSPSSTREMTQQAKIAAALSRAGMGNPQAWSSAEFSSEAATAEDNAPPPTLSARYEVCLREVSLHEVRLQDARPEQASPDEEQSKSSGFNLTPPVVLMKGADDPTFVISFRSQKEIVSALAWKFTAMICGGTAFTLLAFYLLRR
jgi:hypothetical protein